MKSAVDVLGQQNIPRDDRFFSDRWPTAQTQGAREHALVHLRTFSQARFLSVLSDRTIKGLHVLKGRGA